MMKVKVSEVTGYPALKKVNPDFDMLPLFSLTPHIYFTASETSMV
jgi:hypothetical protein